MPAQPAQSREPDHTLKLFFGHTGERAEFTFKRNGRYDRTQLDKINHFLRDWRRNETIHMDPHLLDLVWAIYQKSGSHDFIHVVSAYRSPTTNEMLRKRSSGVAKNSQHRLGKAMDWFVTDVPLSKLREVAMKMQGGGVGYYPRSGSPFIHTDTGNVRAWPRMSRQQLIALFPNGNTLHLPADGKPLPGYEKALAQRKASSGTALAYLETEPSNDAGGGSTDSDTKSWLARVFPGDTGNNGGNDAGDDEDAAETAPATAAPSAAPAPALAAATTDDLDVRTPRARPTRETEMAAAETSAPFTVAAVDTDAMTMLVMPALTDRALAGTLSPDAVGIGAPRPRPATPGPITPAKDAIATLLSPAAGEQPPAPQRPVELAYAPAADTAADSVVVSDADRAILQAFAAATSETVEEADARLADALRRRAAGAKPTTAEPGGAVILASAELPGYDTDEDALLDLIDSTTPPDPKSASLAMPQPQDANGFYVAPEGASEVSDLRGDSGPPVDHFAQNRDAPSKDEEGFFTKLFASLIE